MKYVLEAESEFERLESQSATYGYDFKDELANFRPKKDGLILDAGCGSGIVSRYLAKRFPLAEVVGCDSSELRVQQAKKVPFLPANLRFESQDLTQLKIESGSVDAIVCRYVVEHLSDAQQKNALAEFYRCVRPGGTICVVDFDGLLYNISPQTQLVSEVLAELQAKRPVDLWVGRKIPAMVLQAGFQAVKTRIESCFFQDEDLLTEIETVKSRFEQAFDRLAPLFGGEKRFRQFCVEYVECLQKPGAVLFYNKFVVQATRRA